MVEIPQVLQRSTVTREGAAGVAWLASLPTLVEELLQCWDCVPVGPATSGKVGIVLPAKSAAHGEVVIKVSFPRARHEADAYAAWQGRGAVALLASDEERFAMLLERIGPDRPHEAVPVDDCFAIVGDLARRLAVPAPAHLPRLSGEAPAWTDTIGRAAGRLPARVVDAAKESVRDLCLHQPDTMVHGDLHFNNVLRGVREPWQVIDPRGCAGDPAYDAITTLRTAAIHLLDPSDYEAAIGRWVTIFAEAAGLDREHVRRWAQARCVANAQFLWEHNRPEWVRGAHDRFAVLLT